MSNGSWNVCFNHRGRRRHLAGGGMTAGMMGGMAGIMGSGVGPVVLLLLAIIALLVYGLF